MFHKAASLLLLVGVTVCVAVGQRVDFPMTDKEHKIAAGFYSESGRYKGGIPKRSGELETYVCSEYAYDSTNSTAIACVEWSVNEFGGGETETGSCTCGFFNDRFCSGYSCYTVEEDAEPTCTKTGKYTKNCVYHSDVELATCDCSQESDNGLYCKSWECEEIDDDAHVEFEEYECRLEAGSGEFCQAWTGVIHSREEFEQTTCFCDSEWAGDAVCSVWKCEEREYEMCGQAGPGWCSFGIAVGVGGTFGAIGFIVTGVLVFLTMIGEFGGIDTCLALCGAVVWACLWSIGVVIWGGVYAVEAVAMYWAAPIILGLFFGGVFRLYRWAEDFGVMQARVDDPRVSEEEMGKTFK